MLGVTWNKVILLLLIIFIIDEPQAMTLSTFVENFFYRFDL